MIITSKSVYKAPPLFSVNIDEILVLDIWRIFPCNFQIKLRNAFDIEVEDLIFKDQILYKRTQTGTKLLKEIRSGFLKNGYRNVINFFQQVDCKPKSNENFLHEFSLSANLTNIFQAFGEPDFHTGTSEGYDIFIYFGSHKCSQYYCECNGIIVFVINISGNISAYNIVLLKCPCYFQDADLSKENNVYVKIKKSEFI